jgi:hypothetical protein
MGGLDDAASELESIARHLRRAGDGDLVREITAAMRRAAGPVQNDIRAGLRQHLPDRYAATLDADLRLGSKVSTSGSDPGVTITAQTRGGRKLRQLDAGRLTHPVYGNREHWASQGEPSVRPGWFTGPARAAKPRVRAELERALEDVAGRAAGKGA